MGFLAQIGAAIASLFIATLGSIGFLHQAQITEPVPTTLMVQNTSPDNSLSMATTLVAAPIQTATTTILDSQGNPTNYSKDGTYVYYSSSIDGNTSIIQGADPQSFIAVSGQPYYDAQDKNHKYFFGKIACDDGTPISNPALKEIGNSYFFEDSNEVCLFLDVGPVEMFVSTDTASFTILDPTGTYAKDAEHIYYYGDIIQGADPVTFQEIAGNGFDAEDQNHQYLKGQIVQ